MNENSEGVQNNTETPENGAQEQEQKAPQGDKSPEGGEQQTDWRAGLSEELSGKLEGIESFEQLAQKYSELAQNAPKVPEKAEDYGFEKFAGSDDEAFIESVSKAFHEAKLTPEQAKGVEAFLSKHVEDNAKAYAQQIKEQPKLDEKTLRAEWKNAYSDRYDTAQKAIRSLPEDVRGELEQMLADAGAQNNPAIIKAFEFFGSKMSEDSFAGSSDKGGKDKSLAKTLYPNLK